ncbi:hypothetical protein GGI25_001536 [Coemansia spiralis]|uniref:Uncharacterized protein n=2 Tax=Coemansia TaxID=4863 RepID=A0A9W8KYC7_9FUNG|nr:hypothetical protein EDC05_002039 [Coemansia umbellata]KAJ2622987.1 hypothetical protein GGI26_002788 [Coemansia sp. RSA 1358]KAJ2679401.1 hypothetical protein GGI25_001536 [Coemansia spiralis]
MTATAHVQEHHQLDSAHSLPRRRVKQLSSVKAWCQTYGMEMGQDSDVDIVSYESFPDLRKLLEEECAEIERRELEAKATLEARIKRRNSDPLSEASSVGSRGGSEYGGSSIIGSLYRLIDPLIPGLGGPGANGNSNSSSSSSPRGSSHV